MHGRRGGAGAAAAPAVGSRAKSPAWPGSAMTTAGALRMYPSGEVESIYAQANKNK